MILAIDTVTDVGSVAVVDNNAVLVERIIDRELNHMANLLPTIDKIFSENDLDITDIKGFAVDIGPGSFTGIRVGIATIEGFRLPTSKPAVGITSMEVLAYTGHSLGLFQGKKTIVPVIDAKRTKVYACVYKYKNGEFKIEKEPFCVLLEKFTEMIPNNSFIFSPDYVKLKDKLALRKDSEWYPDRVIPSAGVMGRLVVQRGLDEAKYPVKPFYVGEVELRKAE